MTSVCPLELFQSFKRLPRNCICNIFCNRTLSINSVLYKENLSIELWPEVENLFKAGELKHRKHPGLRKGNPIRLPDILKSSVEKIIPEERETFYMKEAEKLCSRLWHRRLPVEKYEIEQKIHSVVPEFEGDFDILPHIINKQEMKGLRKTINLEMGRWKPIEYNYHTCLSYLVGRIAANYASTSDIFEEIKKRIPSFKPQKYFDFGSGVGSSLWAAHTHWSDSIKEYFCVDAAPDMNDICGNLITDELTEEKFINPVYFRQFLPASDLIKYDLVVSAFSLLELTSRDERLKVIDTLWRKTEQLLVIIEYGTVAGFHCVLDARDFILQVENDSSPEFSMYCSGAHVVSPCPHDFTCPKFMEKTNSSCGFIVPYYTQFPREHTQVISKDFISYIVIRKSPRNENYNILNRIVKPVAKKPRHVTCNLCCVDGKMKEVTLTKSKPGRDAYRCARASIQGDILPVNMKEVEMLSDEDVNLSKT